ncbi:MAG: VCBS repeat-containing protein [Candidatus Manganitrophaceae bacterium]
MNPGGIFDHMVSLHRIALPILILLSLLGCGRNETKEPVSVAVNPTFFKIPSGGEVQLSTDVSGTLNQEVSWEVSGPSGSSISSIGLFRAPLNAGGKTASIRAISQDNPAAVGNGAVSMTSFSKLAGETVPAGSDQITLGGFTVRTGQTIDLNGDGILDLLSGSPSGNLVTAFLGVGNGLFRKQAEISVNQPIAVAVGDFINTSEFVADIAIASRTDGNVQMISGKFGPSQNPLPTTVAMTLPLSGKIPSALASGRFHGAVESQNSDLAVGTDDGSIVLLLQDRLSGVFSPQSPVDLGGKPTRIITADFNRDNFLDMAVLREGATDTLILLGDGNGRFAAPISTPFPSPPTSIAIGDFNDDQIPDLAATHAGMNQISISFGNGNGTFGLPRFHAVESAPASIAAGDFNLGGKTDIVVTLPDSNAVLFLFGDGSGAFIGKFRSDVAAPPLALISGFFSGFQSPQGFQNIGFIYLNGTENRFYLLNNLSS